MSIMFEQFVAFGTDIIGLERLLRFFQAVFMILTSWPALIAQLLPHAPAAAHVSAETSLAQLQGRLNVTRRALRLFRFLDSFRLGWDSYLAPDKSADAWLDVLAKTCLGVFGMLESVTLLDLMDVDHLEPFGKAATREINRQAQIFWFAALYASVLATCVRLLKLFAHSPVPQAGSGYGTGEKPAASSSTESETASKEDALAKEREGLKGAAEKRKAERKAWAREVSGKAGSLGLKLMGDVLDLVLPSSAVGWVVVNPGLVGTAMLCSTVITSMDVWDRCGREVRGRAGRGRR